MLETTPPAARGRSTARGVIAVAGAASVIAGCLVAAAAPATAATLPATVMDAGATWQYSDTNLDPAAGSADRLVWTTASYDDSAWKTGTNAFGAKNGLPTGLGADFPVTTLLNQYIDPTARSKVDVPTFHFRSSFTLDSSILPEISGLTGKIRYDDGAQIFVNGVKVAGLHDDRVEQAPEAQRNLMYAGSGASDPITATYTIPTSVLTAGENTIAVALYQDRATSSDIYLDMGEIAPVGKTPGAASLSDLVLGVGADEASRNLTWYSSTDTEQVAQLAPSASVIDGAFPASTVTVKATGGATTSGEFTRKATLSGLTPHTAYSYRVGAEGAWSAVQSFRTGAFDGDFEFFFVGDPQIGASGNVANDQAGWIDTLNVAQQTYPEAEMIFSAGDQVESAGNESHYTSFLAPEQLRSLPLAVTNGNHDVGSKAYTQHFNVPNLDESAGAASSGSSSGGDYWFFYKDVLFVNINSNSRDYASHNAFMEKVVAEQGAKAKWKVLAFHHSIYSVAAHYGDSDIRDRRANMPAKISELGFDVVLQGHDHSYTRSYLVKDGELADSTEVAGQAEVSAKKGEVLYVTANSASGSKYYGVTAPDAWFASVINQERVRNYSVVKVTDEGVKITTLRSQANGTSSPVNSVVDEVTLTREADPNAQQLQVTVPDAAPGEFSWNIDGTNALVDLGVATEQGDHFLATGSINPIRVTDTRLGGPQWSVSAQVSDFRAGDQTFSGTYLGWTPRVVEDGAGAVAGAAVASGFDSGEGLSTSATLGSGATGHTRGTAKLGADLELKLPVDVADGTYRGTLTLTALS
ncbi:fibronectin type III domain-containing protein [Microbacterium sp. NPDC091313]